MSASPKLRNQIANTSFSQRLTALTTKKDERFSFAPAQFQKDLARLSEPTKKALLANHNQTALQILSVNPKKDFAIAKFDVSNSKQPWISEHIGFSSIAGRAIETRVELEGRSSNRWQVQFTIDNSLTRPMIKKLGQTKLPKESVSSTRLIQKRITSMMLEHVKNLPPNATLVASAVESDGGGRGRTAIYRRYGFKPNPESAMSEVETEVSISRFIELAATRADASTEGGQGKPCGASHISKAYNCTKNAGSTTREKLKTAAKVALAAGVLAGGAYLFKKKYFTKEEWDKHPANKLNNPKISEAQAQRIADEAIAGGKKWDAQEKINARRRSEECGGGLGKIQAPAKFDSRVGTPRCEAGFGAFGTYFVHSSEKYGIKLFRNGDEDDVASEFRRLDKADYAGVNVPSPLRMQAIKDPDGEVRAQTLILTHMKGYKTLSEEHHDAYGTAVNAPLIVQRNIARQFRLLHTAGLAHGDIHSGNVMVNPRSRKVALIDFGYATELHDGRQPAHYRNGVQNLLYDMNRLPEFLGFSSRGQDFLERYKGVLSNVHDQAKELATYGGRDNEERFQIAVKRYHDALEAELLWDDRRPRSRFVSGADQPRIPGLTRRILTAQRGSTELVDFERDLKFRPTAIQSEARRLGVKPQRLFLALKPERDARFARERQKPFGTNLFPRATTRRPVPVRAATQWED